ncbi:MAG: hypothetical protein L3K19_02590 [Thermoplasmata archaeon]|nr:hypothetical protein [Thermoplasmata archaeon]
MTSGPSPIRTGARTRTVAPWAFAILLILGLPVLGMFGGVHAAPILTPVTGGIAGPSEVGAGQKASYVVHANGGPAFAPNGTQTGILSYRSSLAGENTTGAVLSPPSGVLINQSITLSLIAPNLTESLTIFVLVTSSVSGLNSTNTSNNFSFHVNIVQPFRLTATIVVSSASSVGSFSITVTLDGQPVGTVIVPTLTPGSNYPLSFEYVAQGLAPGWHTFSMNVAPEHGLVTFSGGSTAFNQPFYVPGPAPDNSLWYLAGASAFVVALFIFTTRVGARRRGKSKK